MMAKMKSVWAKGRKPHLARLAPEPDAEHAALGHRRSSAWIVW